MYTYLHFVIGILGYLDDLDGDFGIGSTPLVDSTSQP